MWHIDIEEDFGAVSGYVVGSHKVQVRNYLAEYTAENEFVAAWVAQHTTCVALLKNLNVEELKRGKGLGNDLLDRFIAEAEDELADAILLIADSGEIQNEGFSLTQWYERHDFVQVLQTGAGPLMVYPSEVGIALRSSYEASSAPKGLV